MAGPDIFISYAREDRATAQSLADAFTASGRKVWWDREIQGGSAFATEVEKALTACRLAVVLWSRDAVASDFVRDEARRAMKAGKLLPVFIADVEPPLGFGETHALSLVNWDGSEHSPDLVELLRQVAERLDGIDTSPVAGPRLGGAGRRRGHGAWIGGGAFLAVALAGSLWYLVWNPESVENRCAPPSNAPVWTELEQGYSLFVKGDLATARSTFNRILSGEKNFARAQFYLAQVLIQTRENEIARDLLARVLRTVGAQTDCGVDAGELRKMRDWLASLQSAGDEPTPLPARVQTRPEVVPPEDEPVAAPAPDPTFGTGSGTPIAPQPEDVFRPSFGLGDRPRARIAPPTARRDAIETAVEAAFGQDRDGRIAATTGLVVDPETVSDAVPIAVTKALSVQAGTGAPNREEMSGVINALVLLQSATPATLNAHRASIEDLLARARPNGGQTAAQADKVSEVLQAARGRKPLAYLQIADEAQRPFANVLADRLRDAGYEVPAFEVVGARAPSGGTEIRIQGRSDRELARWMAQTLEKLGAGAVKARSLRKVNPSNDTFEIWLARDLCLDGGTQPATCR